MSECASDERLREIKDDFLAQSKRGEWGRRDMIARSHLVGVIDALLAAQAALAREKRLVADTIAAADESVARLTRERDEAHVYWRELVATHHCKACGARWIDCGFVFGDEHDGWSLASRECGPCCDNVAMGEQIEPIGVFAKVARLREIEEAARQVDSALGAPEVVYVGSRCWRYSVGYFTEDNAVTRLRTALAPEPAPKCGKDGTDA